MDKTDDATVIKITIVKDKVAVVLSTLFAWLQSQLR